MLVLCYEYFDSRFFISSLFQAFRLCGRHKWTRAGKTGRPRVGWVVKTKDGSFSPPPLPLSLFIFSHCLTLRHIPTSKHCTKKYCYLLDTLIHWFLLLHALTKISLQRLQRVINCAARLICSPAGSRPGGISRHSYYSQILIGSFGRKLIRAMFIDCTVTPLPRSGTVLVKYII